VLIREIHKNSLPKRFHTRSRRKTHVGERKRQYR